jgi:hypothetical protein
VEIATGEGGATLGFLGATTVIGGDLKVNFGAGSGEVSLNAVKSAITGSVLGAAAVGSGRLVIAGGTASVGKGIAFTANTGAELSLLSPSLTVGKRPGAAALSIGTVSGAVLLDCAGIVNLKGDVVINGGSGDDSIQISPSSLTVGGALRYHGNAGSDLFRVRPDTGRIAGPVEITAGSGFDTFEFADTKFGGSLKFTGGDDGAAVSILGKRASIRGVVEFFGGAGMDSLNIEVVDSLRLSGGLRFEGGGGGDTLVASGASVSIEGALNFTGGDDEDRLDVIGQVVLIRGAVTIDGGDGSISVSLIGDTSITLCKALTFTGGGAPDSLDLQGRTARVTGAVTFAGAGGFDSLNLSGYSALILSNRLTIDTGDDGGQVTLSGGSVNVAGLAKFDLGLGGNSIEVSADTLRFQNALAITGEAESDMIALAAPSFTVGKDLTANLGSGDNEFRLVTESLTLSGALRISADGGSNQVLISANGNVRGPVALTLAGGDSQLVGIIGNSGRVGNLKLAGTLTVNLDTEISATSFDSFTLRDVAVAKAINITTAEADSFVFIDNLTASDVFNLNTRGGNDEIAIERSDAYRMSLIKKLATIIAGDGDDTIFIGNLALGTPGGVNSKVNFQGGLTVDPGAGSDTGNDIAASNLFKSEVTPTFVTPLEAVV